MPLGLCPGPSQPKDLDSFLTPFLQELEILHHGVPAYDAHSKSVFLLKAHLVLITGDTPGVSKLLHLSGHTAKFPCRACKIEGTGYQIPFKDKKGQIRNITHHYYPFEPPGIRDAAPIPFKIDLRRDFPHRTHDEYIRDGEASSNDPNCARETGIKGVSPLTRLQTISIPESSPSDVMHLVFLGFVRDLCALLNGTFFKAGHLNNHPGRMSEKDWIQLGVDMAKIGAPASWGRYPRNIQKYIKGFKAEELSSFLIHYLLPLSFKRVNASTYHALQ